MKTLLTSVLGAFLLLPFMASADVHTEGCHNRLLQCTTLLSFVYSRPSWDEERIREWGRAKASMPPQEFEKWERRWRQDVERQRREDVGLPVWTLGLCFAVVLLAVIMSRRENKRCSKQCFRVSSSAIISACQKRTADRQNAISPARREDSRIWGKSPAANKQENGHGACRRTGLFGPVASACSWVWFLALAVLTGCISCFFHVAPNVPTVTDWVGFLILGLSLWTLAWPGTGERRGLSQLAQSIVFLFVALIAAFAHAVWLEGERRTRQEWPTASGVIRAVERQGRFSSMDSKYEYAFRVDGREYAGAFSERMLLELSSDNHVRTIGETRERNVGDAVTVFYDPQNPTDSCVRLLSHRGQSFWAGFLLALAIVVLVLEMVRRRRNRVTYGWR